VKAIFNPTVKGVAKAAQAVHERELGPSLRSFRSVLCSLQGQEGGRGMMYGCDINWGVFSGAYSKALGGRPGERKGGPKHSRYQHAVKKAYEIWKRKTPKLAARWEATVQGSNQEKELRMCVRATESTVEQRTLPEGWMYIPGSICANMVKSKSTIPTSVRYAATPYGSVSPTTRYLQEGDAEDQCRAAAARKADAGVMPARAIKKFYKMCLKGPAEAEAWAKKVT
jgi:hypothetical protein